MAAITRGLVWLVQGDHSLSGEGLGQPDAVAGGLADVGVVHEPVNGGGGQGLGHELVESGRVKIARHGHAAPFVGGEALAVRQTALTRRLIFVEGVPNGDRA